jgi:hypothetical protein
MIIRIALVIAFGLLCGGGLLCLKMCVSSPHSNPKETSTKRAEQEPRKEFVGHSDPDHPLAFGVGKFCTVQFKRNALGGGAALPVSPLTNVSNGAEVSCGGKILSVTREGLLLEMDGSRHLWIPMDSILLVDLPE